MVRDPICNLNNLINGFFIGSKEIPQKFLGLWKNLLQLLYTQDVLLSLLINLLKITNNAEAEDQIREMTSLWLQFLCKKLLVTKLQLQYNTDIVIIVKYQFVNLI